MLARYPEVIESAATNYTPHLVAHYLMDLARDFHTYYNAHQFIVDDVALKPSQADADCSGQTSDYKWLNCVGRISAGDVM